MPLDSPGVKMADRFGGFALEEVMNVETSSHFRYFEIQVHGQLSLEDIGEFIVRDQAAANRLKAIAAR